MSGEMPAMPVRHSSFFFPDPVIFMVQAMRFTPAYITISYLVMNPLVLLV
jgi:hypothetical protein